ncbi:MAG: hypothetical protein V1701_00840 [Planctomycetota bacterium]
MAIQQTPDRISFVCPKCNKGLQISQGAAGRNVQCPGCKEVVKVPGGAVSVPVAPAQKTSSTKPVVTGSTSQTRITSTNQPAATASSKSSKRLAAAKSAEPKAIKVIEWDQKRILRVAGAGIAVIMIIIVGIIYLSNRAAKAEAEKREQIRILKEEQDKQAEDARLNKAKKTLEDIIKDEQSSPLDLKELLAKMRRNEDAVKGTPTEEDWKSKKKEISEKSDILNSARKEDDSFDKNPKDFNKPLKAYEKLKADAQAIQNHDALVAEIDRLMAKITDSLKKELDKEMSALEAKIDEAMAKNAFNDALAACDKFPNYLRDLPEVNDKMDKLRDKITQAKEAVVQKRKEWRSLLDVASWNLQGCTGQTDNEGSLVITNERSNNAFAVAGESDLRKYKLEITFKMLQGATTILLGSTITNTGKSITPKAQIPLARKFGGSWDKIMIEVKDNALVYAQGDNAPQTFDVKGGVQGQIAFVFPQAAKMVIKEIRIKSTED